MSVSRFDEEVTYRGCKLHLRIEFGRFPPLKVLVTKPDAEEWERYLQAEPGFLLDLTTLLFLRRKDAQWLTLSAYCLPEGNVTGALGIDNSHRALVNPLTAEQLIEIIREVLRAT